MSARLSLKTLAVTSAVVLPALARLPFRDPAGGQAHTALAQELAACVAGAVAAIVVARRERSRDPIATLGGVLVVLELLSGALAPNPWAALRASALVLAGLATFAAARVLGRPTIAPLVTVGVVASGVVLEALGVLVGWSRTGHAPGGFLGERNSAAELLVCALPFLAWTALTDAKAKVRAAALATLAVGAAALVLTRTRSAWLAAGVLAILGLALAVRTADDALRARAAKIAVCLAAGVAIALTVPTKLTWTSAHPYRETATHLLDTSAGSGAGRLVQYTTTLRMAAAHPLLGVGPGNWAGSYPAFAAPGDPTLRDGFSPTNRLPSSDVLGFVAERGVSAALVALAIALLLARARDPARWLRRATLLAVFVVGSLDAVLQLGPHLLFVAWVLGTASPIRPGARSPAPGVALATACAAGAVLASLRIASFALALHPSGFADLERATQLDPGNVALRLSVAATYVEAGQCARAAPHLAEASRFARVPAADALASHCRTASAP